MSHFQENVDRSSYHRVINNSKSIVQTLFAKLGQSQYSVFMLPNTQEIIVIKTISSLPLITSAAEYFDRDTGAAWKLRSLFTNMAVWAARSYLNLRDNETADLSNLCAAIVRLGTIRKICHTVQADGFMLDMTGDAVRRTLGLHKELDLHAEACRVARQKCMQRRSATQFQAFYNMAMTALVETRERNELLVEEIASTLADNSIDWDGEFIDTRGVSHNLIQGTLTDDDLYDEDAIERNLDQIEETIAAILESMHSECERRMFSALTTRNIDKLSGFLSSIESMMTVVGLNKEAVAKRQVNLQAQMAAAEAEATAKANAQMKEILEQEQAMAEQMAQAAKAEEEKPKRERRHVPKAEAA